MKSLIVQLICLLPLDGFPQYADAQKSRVFPLKDSIVTVLIGNYADRTGEFRLFPIGNSAKHLFIRDWDTPEDSFSWTIRSTASAKYIIYALVKGYNAEITLDYGGKQIKQKVNEDWNRIKLGELTVKKGESRIKLYAAVPGKKLEFYSLELITPDIERVQNKKANDLRSSTAWMRKAKYGLQFHWTSKSQALNGATKNYEEAVRDFDTKKFADMVHETGAGYVILTTSHAEFYFPGPIKSIDSIMPARTSSRDLVSDLTKSLDKYGIKLMLYFHVGHDHYLEPDGWWKRFGFNSEKPEVFLNNWKKIISEVGSRYEDKLAGWFFDDGVVYYPLNPDFEDLAKAAKAGNKNRVICFNPWIFPKLTDYQDYLCGEGYDFLKNTDNLPADGRGIYTEGPHINLQAHTNFILERDWGHFKKDIMNAPSIPLDNFIRDMTTGISHGLVPSVNIEISQEGEISAESLRYMKILKGVIHEGKPYPITKN